MSRDRYKILKHCEHLIKAYKTTEWNSKSDKTERLDNGTFEVDVLDACEYSTEYDQSTIIEVG